MALCISVLWAILSTYMPCNSLGTFQFQVVTLQNVENFMVYVSHCILIFVLIANSYSVQTLMN